VGVVVKLRAIRCKCGSEAVSQIDWVEAEYPIVEVDGQGRVVVDLGAMRVDQCRIGRSLYRCKSCGREWDVPKGTRFVVVGRRPRREGK
jgi:DNA-directed RNA polymerase subunit RPC12/RpoP